MNFSDYNKQLAIWHQKYGPIVPSQSRRTFNPSKINNCCRKCGKEKSKMSRHHKANDFFFATILPDVYARRYIEFRADDIDLLCQSSKSCHRRWHNYIKPKLKKMYDEWDQIKDLKLPNYHERWAAKWRTQILWYYENWIASPTIKSKKKNAKSRR